MQDPYLEGRNQFYSLLEFFPSVKQESTERSIPERLQKRQSYVYIETCLNQLRPNCRTGLKVLTGNGCINLAPKECAKCTKNLK